jgi:hypothetical protein
MLEAPSLNLRVVSGDELDEQARRYLRPGEAIRDRDGNDRILPTHFYQIPSWEAALDTQITTNFGLWELIDVDHREPEAIRIFPRYVPCAITILAGQLQLLRNEFGRIARVAANGGYRSPSHEFAKVASPHSWGTAANVYRIGDEWLDSREKIEKYREVARSVLTGAWTRPYGDEPGGAFDHLHIDLGYLTVQPHTSSSTKSDKANGKG